MSGENKAEISILPSSGITSLRTDGVNWIAVGPDADGQRVDNYLARVAKGVPKSHIYRIIRAGEVRVNKARVKAETKLVEGDLLRVPPIRISQKPAGRPAAVPLAEGTVPVLYEDMNLSPGSIRTGRGDDLGKSGRGWIGDALGEIHLLAIGSEAA